ncbi:PilT/PilU family type 4a pilus ATPase [bacterium]|nr:PilT/PilU family type 4a pilus ATPase [bacterium]
MHIDELLRIVIKKGASDLHLGAGRPPFLRLDGDLMPADWDILDEEEMERFAKQLLTPKREYRLEEENEIDFAYVYKGDDGLTGRFRVNIYRQKGSVAAALRLVNDIVPSFEDLNLPLILEELSLERRGIIILTGTTGSGKSTTLASMIDYVNNRRPVHILTIEDPIEYVLKDKEAIINQRELGVDTNSFMDAIRGAMREDPDIILIGEMRDRETVNATFQAALTGHLVLSTLHTLNVTQTISRVIDFYPETMQKQARLMLSETIKSIISMRLLPMVGGGRIPAMEIMKVTGRIKEFIEDEEKTELIKLAMEEGEDEGMITFDRYLLKMYHLGQITYETALAAASSPHDFKLLEQQNTDFSDKVLNRVDQFVGTRGDGTPSGGI